MKAKALKTKVGSSPNKIRRGIHHFPTTSGMHSHTPGYAPPQAGVRETAAHIFRSNLNNNFKLTPFNSKLNDLGEVRYLPPVSKE